MEELIKILNKAEALFMKYGVRSVTMDDLTRELGISKKTLYQYVANKDELIQKVLDRFMAEDEKCTLDIMSNNENAIAQLLAVETHVNQVIQRFNPSLIYDLQKYYKASWDEMEKFQRRFIYDCMVSNMQRGIQEGLYRTDFNPDILARIFVASALTPFNTDFFPFPEYQPIAVHQELMRFQIRGIVTPQGLEMFEHYVVS